MVTWNDFEKIWASTSPLTPYEFSDPNYSQGWNFVGSTPPARQMWDSIQKKNDEKFKYLRDNFGTPNIVTSSSQMTDTEKVYVYMGSEAGWNSGHWYYYDEGTSSWADGGVYNSVAFVTDPTLSIAGQPADAKATGDALALKADLAGCTFTGNVNVSADLSVTGTSTLAGDVTASSDLSVAGDSALTNLSVSGTTALAGTSTAPTPSADDNSTKIATTEYVQTEIKPIETDVTINDKRITNIEKLLQGNLYDYQTDSTSAYTKSVPAGAMPYAGLEKVGGRTVVWNQLYGLTSNHSGKGVSVSIVNGYATFSGEANESGNAFSITWTDFKIVVGHKYLWRTTIQLPTDCWLSDQYNDVYNSSIIDKIFTASQAFTALQLWISGTAIGADFTDVKGYLMFYDLTLMFGAGNEPSTVAEFESMFPADYYAYNEGELLSAGVTSVVSKDSNNATLQTYSIPAEVQALEGYGWSAGTAYNYVDFERKVFVQNVGSVLYNGTENWTRYKRGENVTTFYLTLSTKKFGLANMVCSGGYTTVNYTIWGYTNYFACCGNNSLHEVNFAAPNNSIDTVEDFKALLQNNPITVYYELDTPVETDISEYLTNDNLIQVEAGGTLTFPNSNGTDYQIPVPSEETYMIDLQEAINNG